MTQRGTKKYAKDDNYCSKNKGEYGSSERNGEFQDEDSISFKSNTSEDYNCDFASDNSSSRSSSNDDSDGLSNVKSKMKKQSNRNITANIQENHTDTTT